MGFAVSKADGSESFYEGETQTFTLSTDLCVRAIFRKEAYVSLNTLLAGTQNLSALSGAGLLYSWGGNNSAQNGNGFSSGLVSSPAIAAGGVKFATVSNGGAGADVTTTVYITEDGSVYTFGGNSSGQLGRSGDTTVGQKVSFPQKAVMAAAGYDHTLVLLENGDLYGAGSNSNGQLGNPLEVGANFYTFVKVAENVKYVTAGRRHTLFIDKNGDLYGLGDNRWNKLSDEIGASFTAVPVKIKEDVAYAMAGGHNTFYVTREDGVCYYRGWRSLSFDNTASANTEIVFHQIASGVRDIAMQESHALILANDGTLYGWGENGSGQILQGGSALYETPVKIMDGVSQAAAGLGFSAALLEDGTVLCWGSNSLGICANGTATGGVVPPTPAMRLGGVLAQKTAFILGAQELSVLSQGDVGVTVRFANTTGQAQDVMVYLACYDAAGVLLDVKTMKATVGPGFSSQMQGGKTVVVDKNTVKVKAFLWDEMQRPIQAAVQLPKSA